MKKIKLLPLLAVIPMLASCGGKPAKPKFAKFGEEITSDKFNTNVEAAAKKTVVVTTALPSGLLKTSEVTYYETEVKRNKKVIAHDVQIDEESHELKHDVKDAVVEAKKVEKHSFVNKSKTENQNDSSSITRVYTMQEAKVDDNKYVVEAYKKTKEFEKVSKITDGLNTAKSIIDGKVRELMNDGNAKMIEIETAYAGASAEGKKEYKFYQNEKIFTIEFKTEIDREHKNGEDKVEYVEKGNEEKIVQLELDKDKLSYKFWHLEEYEREYKLDKGNYAKGDLKKVIDREVKEGTWQRKDVTLKALDLANFTKVGASW